MDSPSRPRALLALLLLVPAPSLGVIASFVLWPGAFGQAIYGLSKVWILLLPVVWWFLVQREHVSFSPIRPGEHGKGIAVGFGSGFLIVAFILGAHLLLGPKLLDPTQVRAATAEAGLDTPARYLALAIYLTLINSLLEEFVWRWFVFRQCEALVGGRAAVALSAIFFSVHHLVALKVQMAWPAALICTFGVLLGGAIWSGCYLRFRSIWPGYFSHILADVAVFGIGWSLIFGGG